MCGGTLLPTRQTQGACGLSPRVRGNLYLTDLSHNGQRSIPACAGEPEATWTCWIIRMVYPRVCGGTTRSWLSSAARFGLSPRVRGNPLGILLAVVVLVKVGWGLFYWVGRGCEWESSGSVSGL